MSAYIRCPGCFNDSLDVDNLTCDECGYESGMSETKALRERIDKLEADLAAMTAERDALLLAANEVCDANNFTEAQQAVRLLNTERWKVRAAIDAARQKKEG